MTLEKHLIDRFGPLIPLADLASMLDRSPASARMYLRSDCVLARHLNAAKLKVGRRIFFRTAQVAHCLDDGDCLAR